MFQQKILIIISLVVLTVLADPVMPVPTSPGYVNCVYGGIIKSAYGVCYHTSYFTPDDGVETCGELLTKENYKSQLTNTTISEKKVITESEIVLFIFNSNELTSDGKRYLYKTAEAFKNESNINYLIIDGYTDKLGKSNYNLKLSQKRANTIRDFFINDGFNAKMISANGYGETESGVSDLCITKYDSNTAHNELLKCTAPDRKVILTVKRTQIVSKTITSISNVSESINENIFNAN